jgi:hypothetical protein
VGSLPPEGILGIVGFSFSTIFRSLRPVLKIRLLLFLESIMVIGNPLMNLSGDMDTKNL